MPEFERRNPLRKGHAYVAHKAYLNCVWMGIDDEPMHDARNGCD
jgi:hypothetical protein